MDGGSTLVYVNIFVREEMMPLSFYQKVTQTHVVSPVIASVIFKIIHGASIPMLSRDFAAISDVGMVRKNKFLSYMKNINFRNMIS